MKICGIHELDEELKDGKKWDAIVSILDPPQSMMEQQQQHELRQRLSSATAHLLSLNFRDSREWTKLDLPTKEDVKQLEDFAPHCDEKKQVLIHCRAGISRSTAAAIVIWVKLGQTPAEALKRIYELRPLAQPNRCLLSLAGIQLLT